MVIVVAIISAIGLWYFVTRTKTGRAVRAVAEDKEIAGLMGINVDRTIVTTFAIGGAMAGVAALMWALLFRSVDFTTGFLPGIKAFTAAVLGGIGNLPGAMLGGVLLGLVRGNRARCSSWPASGSRRCPNSRTSSPSAPWCWCSSSSRRACSVSAWAARTGYEPRPAHSREEPSPGSR